MGYLTESLLTAVDLIVSFDREVRLTVWISLYTSSCAIVLATIGSSGFFYLKTKTIIFDNLQKRGLTVCDNLAISAKFGVLTEDTEVLDELAGGVMEIANCNFCPWCRADMRRTSDAVEILHRTFIKGDPKRLEFIEKEKEKIRKEQENEQ